MFLLPCVPDQYPASGCGVQQFPGGRGLDLHYVVQRGVWGWSAGKDTQCTTNPDEARGLYLSSWVAFAAAHFFSTLKRKCANSSPIEGDFEVAKQQTPHCSLYKQGHNEVKLKIYNAAKCACVCERTGHASVSFLFISHPKPVNRNTTKSLVYFRRVQCQTQVCHLMVPPLKTLLCNSPGNKRWHSGFRVIC